MHYRNIELFYNLLLEFFLNRCKKVTKSPKFRKKLLLKFDVSFIKKTKSKFEKNSMLRGKATIPL